MSNGAQFEDGDYAVLESSSLPVLSAPIPGVNVDYVLKQDFVQYEASFASAPLNSHYPKDDGSGGVSGESWAGFTTYFDAGFILVEESPRTDLGDGVVRWTRTYAQVPEQHSSPTQMAYNFIGFCDFYLAPVIYRQRFSRTVPATSVFDYFLASSSSTTDVNAVITANFIQEQLYTWPRVTGFTVPPESQASDYISNTASPATVPTLAAYAALITAGTQIEAMPSQFSRWMGNIIRRERTLIYPQ